MRRQKYYRLRDDVSGRLMPIQTLNLILQEHKRSPWQQLYLFGWRHQKDRLTIYDLDLPWRKGGIDEECTRGRGVADVWLNSVITNTPTDCLQAWSERGGSPGYKKVLMQLLREGSIIPSTCLDDWLQGSSLKLCDPWLRIRYKNN